MTPLRRWAIPGVVISTVLGAALMALLDPGLGDTVGAPAIGVGFAAAGTLMIRRSGPLRVRERVAWIFLAAGLYSASAGVLVTAVLYVSGLPVPAIGVIDLFFLAAYSLFLVALYRWARADKGGRDWALTILDALVGAIALGALIWTVFFNQLVESLSRAPTWEGLIAAVYPALDIAALVALMILILRRSHFHWDPRLLLIAFGISFQVIADLLYLQSGVGQSFAEAQPVYPLFLLAIACLVAAGAIVDRVPRMREYPQRHTPVLALVWPYLLVAALLGAHVGRYHSVSDDLEGVVLLDALLVIGAVALLRQLLMTHRHRTRVENQRSELVASVSHELRTPLTAMVGYLTLLEGSGDEFSDEVREEMLSEAAGQARHLARLVSDLVMLARGGDHPVPLEITEVPVSSIVSRALRNVDPETTSIEEDLADDYLVRLDPDRVQQALSNLLTNAVRYGGDRVLLASTAKHRDLVLEVHDDGGGLPTRHESAVWERFERGAHRLNASTPGMGIGLSIVKAVAEAHGGKAAYRRSEILGGACFSVSIPGCVIGSAVRGSLAGSTTAERR